eukprot:1314280-Pyramimonas_sp.AAC.1
MWCRSNRPPPNAHEGDATCANGRSHESAKFRLGVLKMSLRSASQHFTKRMTMAHLAPKPLGSRS